MLSLLFLFKLKIIPIVQDVFPLGFWSGSIAIRYASYHFQDRSVPTPLRYENHAEKKNVPMETEDLSDIKTGTEP